MKPREKCSLCEYMSHSKRHISTHFAAIHEGKTYPCSLCSFQATQPQSLKQHKRRLHGIDKLSCTNCDQRFTSKESLTKHLSQQHGIETVIETRNKPNYKPGQRYVTGPNKSKCVFCEKYVMKRNIPQHLKRHRLV